MHKQQRDETAGHSYLGAKLLQLQFLCFEQQPGID